MGRAGLATMVAGTALTLSAFTAAPASASPHDFTDPIFSADARGDIVTIGNVTTECDGQFTNVNWTPATSTRACNAANDGSPMMLAPNGTERTPINNRLFMDYVDIDGDGSTFASSSANLQVPAGSSVLWAGLHWNAATDVPDPTYDNQGAIDENPPVATAQRHSVKLRAPGGGYTTVAADDTWDDTNPGGTVSYGGYIDITDVVTASGPGAYTVADVQSCTGFGGCFGSWSITVAYANEAEPARNLNVWHGWQLTAPSLNDGAQEFTVGGITPPPSGPVNARIGVVQADGDRSLGPDSLQISSPSTPWTPFTTPLNPVEDFFRSVISTGQAGSPNRPHNLNTDIALVERDDVVGNSDTSFAFRVQTGGSENLYSQVVHSAVDLYEPEISIDKTATPAAPTQDDQVTWTLKVDNAGIDTINRAVVTDPIPAGVEYIPGSVSYTAGGPAALLGAKTDAAGDDQVDWDAAARTLTMRVGAGASGTDGGVMGIAPAADGSDTITISFKTTAPAPGTTVENTAAAYGEGRELDDPFGPIITEDDDPATVTVAPLPPVTDLGITKTDSNAVVRKVGDIFTYGLEVTNAGPDAATGVVINDDLDPMIKFAGSTTGCTAVGQAVTCPIGDLAVDEAKTVDFDVEVKTLPGAGKVIPNLASVTGNEENPDCVPPTPDALCNEDNEETPQPEVDLGIVKTDGDAVIAKVGDIFSYSLEVTNAGPDAATGVTVTDPLDARLAFENSSDGCAAEGQDVTCLIGDLAAGETKTVAFDVKVLKLPEPAKTIPNIATVTGNEEQPDCTPETPDALCDSDDEETPGPKPVTPTPPAKPTAPSTPSTPASVLPRTGQTVAGLVGLGALLIGGGAALMASRRRTGMALTAETSHPNGFDAQP